MWYIGDPCYLVDDDERWDNFCKLTYAKESLARAKEYGGGDHVVSVINFEGQEIVLWEEGGDGEWTFNGLKTVNKKNSFSVDGGIFCVIDLRNFRFEDDPAECGLMFKHEPELEVKDGVVYITSHEDQPRGKTRYHDNRFHECDNCSSLVRDSWYDDEAEEDRCEECW